MVMALAADALAQLQVVPYVSGLSAPVEFVQDPASPDVQFVVEKGGRIRVISFGTLLPTPFLDVSGVISSGGERGLLGLAFSPDYPASGRFFINFTDTNGNTVVARFKRSSNDALVADPHRGSICGGEAERGSSRSRSRTTMVDTWRSDLMVSCMWEWATAAQPTIPSIPHSARTRCLANSFASTWRRRPDPEGYVVPADNPFVDGVPIPALPEIWAFGLRNPWKFSFDQPTLGGTGAMLIGDVGQGQYQEVDYQPPGAGGMNYGWRAFEGAHPYITSPGAAYLPLASPMAEYGRTVGRSITGGFVYRGYSLGAAYRGRYFYADFVSGRVFSIALIPAVNGGVTVWDPIEHTAELGGSGAVGNISAFGLDSVGELYIVSYYSGQILKVVRPPVYRPLDPSDIDGDHKAESAGVAPSSGAWLGTRSSDGGSLDVLWGGGFAPYNDLPVPADYDGDGRTDIAVWRPSSGTWYIRRSTDDMVQALGFGGGYPP